MTRPPSPALARPLGDQLELPDAERAAVVQVDVDAGAVALGEAEDDVEVPHRVAVHAGRVDPADRLDARLQRLLEQFRGAGVGQHPVLRERHLLHRDPAVEPLDGRAHRLDAAQPDLGVDVGVAAHVRGPGRPPCAPAAPRCGRRRDAELAAAPALVGDPVGERVAGRVRHPRPAVQRLVEVAVRVDEPRQHQPAGHVEHLGVARDDAGLDPLDDAVAHQDVGGAVVAPGPASAQQQIGHPEPPSGLEPLTPSLRVKCSTS